MNVSVKRAAATRLLGTWLIAVLAVAVGGCTSSVPPASSAETEVNASQSDAGMNQSGDRPQSAAAKTASAPSQAEDIWNKMTLDQQVASVLMLHYPGTDANAAAAFVKEIQPGGLILMGNNIPQVDTQLIGYLDVVSAEATLPLLIAIDQEGGTVSRLQADPAPGPEQLRNGTPETTEEAFRARGSYLHSLGINTNFGIVADVTADPESFIADRTLGSTPQEVSDQVRAAVSGEREHVNSTIKHFPGHGAAEGDSHISIPNSQLTEDEWWVAAAPPFEAGIDAGTQFVMVGHLRYPNIDPEVATLSPRWYQILRERLGFEGVIITDDMQMLRGSGQEEYADAVANAVAALNAGTTMVLDVGSTNEDALQFARGLIAGISKAVESGELPETRLREAGLQLLQARLALEE